MVTSNGMRKRVDPPSGPTTTKESPERTQKQASQARKTAGPVKLSTLLALVLAALGFVLVKRYQSTQIVEPEEVLPSVGALPGAHYNDVVVFAADESKRDAVVRAFQHAWHAYERDAMGDDEYHPIGQTGSNLTDGGGIGYTVVDSMDTMVIMGLDEEYQRARKWVEDILRFDADGEFNTFETTIRVLGGLLSTYHLTEDELFLEKATDLGDRLLSAFSTASGLPLPSVNLAERKGVPDKWSPNLVSTAEVSTLQLELRYLSMLTDDDQYWQKAERVMAIIRKAQPPTGLASIFMSHSDGRFAIAPIRLGSRGDSYYEYLLKQYLQTSMQEPVYREMYEDAMAGITKHLLSKSPKDGLLYTVELLPSRTPRGDVSWALSAKQDHLVCFLGGSLMLGAVTTGANVTPVSIPPRAEELTPSGRRDWANGVALIETCMRTHDTKTGLSPEIVHFKDSRDKANVAHESAQHEWYIKGARPGGDTPYDARYILRPETVESLFVAYRLTGDGRYRDYGWSIFEAIETHCRIESGGYASVLNVDQLPVEHDDKMETFLMSETFKYLYLLFEDDTVLPLSKYVFNTEAHPLPIFTPAIRTGFS